MFKITMPIYEHSIVKSINEDGEEITKRRIIGIASGTELDRDEEEFALSAVKAMQRAIEDGITTPDGTHTLVPLQSDHKASWLTDLGYLTKAWIEEDDDKHNLWIEAELNESPSADYFFKLLSKENAPKLGLSIGGLVTKAHKKIDKLANKSTLVFEHILLKEVSVVSQPAYPTQYLQALSKSYQQKEDDDMKDLVEKEVTEAVEEVEVDKNENEAVADGENTEPVVKEENSEAKEDGDGVVKSVSPEEFTTIAAEVGEVKKAVTDLTEILNSMKADYAHLSVSFSKIEETASAFKSVSDETVTTDSVVQKAMGDAFVTYTEKAIAPLVQMIRELEVKIEEIASQPVDKSLTIISAEANDTTPLALYQKQKAQAVATHQNWDPIDAAVKSVMNR